MLKSPGQQPSKPLHFRDHTRGRDKNHAGVNVRGRSHRSTGWIPWSWLMHRLINSRRVELVL
ncbi:MAG: hypothetical protein ACXVAT_20300, partial [Isosphaeraceae bacterium]